MSSFDMSSFIKAFRAHDIVIGGGSDGEEYGSDGEEYVSDDDSTTEEIPDEANNIRDSLNAGNKTSTILYKDDLLFAYYSEDEEGKLKLLEMQFGHISTHFYRGLLMGSTGCSIVVITTEEFNRDPGENDVYSTFRYVIVPEGEEITLNPGGPADLI